ncbi:hypothetical protein MBLNU457_g0193t1 [Dothideomycetes sp. NU457]
MVRRFSNNSDNLAPPPSPYPDHVDPSPTDSNGTENTEIEEDAQEQTNDDHNPVSPSVEIISPKSSESLAIDTNVPVQKESGTDDPPPSVIHAPSGFKPFDGSDTSSHAAQSAASPTVKSVRSEGTVVSPNTPEPIKLPDVKRKTTEDSPRIDTNVVKRSTTDKSTPKASTLQEAEEARRRRSKRDSGLQDISEASPDPSPTESSAGHTSSTSNRIAQVFADVPKEIVELREALDNAWTLCKSLENLSSSHRNRMFAANPRGTEENSWRTCWRLCQSLYDTQVEPESHVQTVLELSRDFCQALFEVRQRVDPELDSVLRVSFELNNHLYNIHDRNLPQAFRQRTLDFYVALCHRMIKTRTALPSETDALLKACWSLSEMLFNIRNPRYEPQTTEEELLVSAIQACWDLSNLFREGWSQIRPERATPKPTQTRFPRSTASTIPPSDGRSSSMSNNSYHDATSFPAAPPPETPVTIFDDVTAPSSPDSVTEPNILVLGPATGPGNHAAQGVMTTHHDRWSSNASTLSGYSEDAASSQRTGSANRTASTPDQVHLARLRGLIHKAALLAGYTTQGGSSNSSVVSGSTRRSTRDTSFQLFIKSLPATAFGTSPAQTKLLVSYKALVAADPTLRSLSSVINQRFRVLDIAKAVRWLGCELPQWRWIKDLFWFVNGFPLEEAERRGGILVT